MPKVLSYILSILQLLKKKDVFYPIVGKTDDKIFYIGLMTLTNDEKSQVFVDFPDECKLPVLDGDSGYGVARIAALKREAIVISNDADERMLYGISRSRI